MKQPSITSPQPSNIHLQIKSTLIKDPLAVLKEIAQIQVVFHKYKEKTSFTLPSYVNKHEVLNPLFFTSECTNSECIYSRL